MRVLKMGEPRQTLDSMARKVAYFHWRQHRDTADIAERMGVTEAAVYNSLAEIRNERWAARQGALR